MSCNVSVNFHSSKTSYFVLKIQFYFYALKFNCFFYIIRKRKSNISKLISRKIFLCDNLKKKVYISFINSCLKENPCLVISAEKNLITLQIILKGMTSHLSKLVSIQSNGSFSTLVANKVSKDRYSFYYYFKENLIISDLNR